MKEFIKKIKTSTKALYIIYIESKWYLKVLIFLVLIYAISPIDLIPDFIPILGYLDDVIIIPLGILICRLFINKEKWIDAYNKASNNEINIQKKYKVLGLIYIILLWIIIIGLILYFVFR